MVGMEEQVGKELHVTGAPDPLIVELNRLENQLKEKERELGVAHAEVKAFRATEALKDKAIIELSDELKKHEEKLGATDKLLEEKNLKIIRLIMEKKEASAAQLAAEAALRRLYSTQRDEDAIPLEAVIAPLQSDIKMYKHEIAILQEDKKALARITRSKEAGLIEAEKILKSAMERVLIVENEENKILDKINRQKVTEVEKLGQTIHDLEESILAGGASANIVRDYHRQVSELNEEKRTLERELARARVSVNRVATVMANEWKDDGKKVIPAKQWLEERRILQGEIQRLNQKLCISERTAKAEAQLKLGCTDSTKTVKRASGLKTRIALEENLAKNNLWVCRSNLFDDSGKENNERGNTERSTEGTEEISGSEGAKTLPGESDNTDSQDMGHSEEGVEDLVSGFLYDRLQKEVITLRKSHEEKDVMLNIKGEEIKMLAKKIEVLTRAMEVESKKIRHQSMREKEAQTVNSEDNTKKTKSTSHQEYRSHSNCEELNWTGLFPTYIPHES
ncbi:hypothetical protein Taro_033893 [Colocasia esculenta]|uniref:Uncharacterized protein n=1 Tax=Colocasia esculenta TaxID=4460 RepID=A0A843WAA5_COLES|nr:hypothetical protein [Colocasia esculenta]